MTTQGRVTHRCLDCEQDFPCPTAEAGHDGRRWEYHCCICPDCWAQYERERWEQDSGDMKGEAS